ncbi:Gfo/Idh/MocA family protein [Paenibacillus cremeus]|uniref:Gfo/Idh/MocA family oxidoreductase n=1 Tax=Paenibacillus cremeus TaxID=2163881 RepID=A0A559JMB9_9BACL|nr:Gfo/Idh/MocA family oxidoreductase [Paenibacillus cremeus]TVY01024.1 Gfo/Idh/MocA family oxidoreductase [Paenibacillus cremeus]
MGKIAKFSIIGGGGFRAQSFLKIAQALPDQFQVSGLVVRNEELGAAMERKWNVTTYRTLEDLLAKEQPDFVVVSVSRTACPDYLLQLAERGIPALSETPPAGDLVSSLTLYEQLTRLKAKVQVAEQYQFQPMHAARIAIAQSGRLGPITEATVSTSHLYHGASLIRKLLNVGFAEATIQAKRFMLPLIAGPTRQGIPQKEETIVVPREIAWIDFGGEKLGIYDWTKDQHRSWIRSNHVSVRGVRGELFDARMNVLADFQTPLHLELNRINRGEEESMEGYFLQGIIAGDSWVYRNPFAPASLSDDEIAMGTCLKRMAEYVQGAAPFYSVAEALQDHYLGMLIEQAVATGERVTAVWQPWAESTE